MAPPRMHPFSFQWDITNLALSPLATGQPLRSPSFTADVLDHTRWSLAFYPKGFDHPRYMALFLQRCSKDHSRFEEVFVDYRLLIESHSVRFCRMKVARCERFARGQAGGCPRLAIADALLHMAQADWPYGRIMITLEMSLSDRIAVADPRWNPRVDLRSLSNDTEVLFQSGLHHDVIIAAQGGIEFKAHRAILAARCPHFDSLLARGEEVTRLDMTDVNPAVLEQLLAFVYSGAVDDRPGFKCSLFHIGPRLSELLQAARQFGMGDLVRRLLAFPKSFVATTQVEVEHAFALWSDPFKEPSQFGTELPCSCGDLQLRCRFVFDDRRGNGDYADLSIRLPGVCPSAPVFVLVYVQLFESEDLLLELHASHHVLEDDSWWEQSFPIEDLELDLGEDKDYRVAFEFTLCDGKSSSFIQDEAAPDYEDRIPVAMDDFRQYSDDLRRLWSRGTFGDFTIVCRGVEFVAHRCILAARSTVFRSMLQHDMLEKTARKAIINDASPVVMKTFLEYMYCGVLPELEYLDVCELYEIADKYAVEVLKNRCGSLLAEKLDPVNVRMVRWLSDLHSDHVLLCRVKNYVRQSQTGRPLDLTNKNEEAVYL